jgi:pyruvate dehydrogenase E1 component
VIPRGYGATDYVNTIPVTAEPAFPGDEDIERRIRSFVRWNAAIMVHRAQRTGLGVGGHISTFASTATLYEVGFNHFFRGHGAESGADQIYFQGHASPGIYARAFLEGRLSASRLDGFRQEISHAGKGGGLPSYPHPRLLPDFWEFTTVSMGLGPMNAIYQARFNRYLHHRGIKDTSRQHIWAFIGDGEMDEPEALGALGVAAREGLDNLTFVVNCNLQRLDGPVRGNGKIIQELESFFRGAGWNVIKVIWGREWDQLLDADREGALVDLLNATPDGDFQTYKSESGAFVRERFFGRDPRTLRMVDAMSDAEIWGLKRGGHDSRKVYAAYDAALRHRGQPTVVLAQTIKGWTLGRHFESRNSTHQMKRLTLEDLRAFRDRLGIPVRDSQLDPGLPPYVKPATGSVELEYLHERRHHLGGHLPSRTVSTAPLRLAGDAAYPAAAARGSGGQPVATTMAFVRLLKSLMKDPEIGHRFVPIIPDEARTFGLDAFFPTRKIYSPHGQHYLSVDRELMLSYQEDTEGVLLHEGITEAGCAASWTAAGTSYATHGEPMIPIYIFYSMFGFQRTGDQLWAAADQLTRGFLLGATAGRTTLNGEGLQHQDGHSLLLASTNPACVAYDPAFGFELGHIARDALRRMYGEPTLGEDPNVFYYLTLYNEPVAQPAEPHDVDIEGILAGMHRYSPSETDRGTGAQILASGIAVPWALEAQQLLRYWGVHADVWSVTSWTQLRREALTTDEWNHQHPDEPQRTAYVTSRLLGQRGPVVAVSDWMRAIPDQIAPYVPGDWSSLGTDGFGLSDTRAALRRHFGVDAPSIALRVLQRLAHQRLLDPALARDAARRYRLEFEHFHTEQTST